MTNMYHSLLHGEREHARAEGGGGGVGRMDAVLMRMVDGGEGGGDGVGGGVGARVVTARPARHSFHVVLKAYADLAERSRTFKERQRCADRMEEIVKIMEQKRGVGGNGVAPSVITYNLLLVAYSRATKLIDRKRTAHHYVQKSEDTLHHMAGTEHARPDKFSFATVLNVIALSRLDDAGDRASALLDRLLDDGAVDGGNGVDIDTATFNAVLKAIVPRGRDEGAARRAEGVLVRMEGGSVRPDKISYSTVMSAFSRLSTPTAPSTVDDLYHRLTTHCRPDTIAYNYRLSVRSNTNTLPAVQEADSLLNDLLAPNDAGLRPDHNSFATVLRADLQLDVDDPRGVEGAEGVLCKMEEALLSSSSGGGGSVDYSKRDIAVGYNRALTRLGEGRSAAHAERSLALLERMVGRVGGAGTGGEEDEMASEQLRIGFNIVMNNFSKVGGEEAAWKVEDIFRSWGVVIVDVGWSRMNFR